MKILNVNGSLDPHDGGTSERTLQMSRHLYKAGADVRVLVTDKHLHEVDLGALPASRVTALPLINERFYVPRVSMRRIREVVGAVDVVHLMTHWTVLNAMVAHAAIELRKPYVHSPAGSLRIMGRSTGLKRIYDRVAGRRIVRNAARMIAITEKEIDDFTAYGVERSRAVVLPNAVDVADVSERDDAGFRRKFRLSDRQFILFLGRLNHIKGPDLLLDAYLGAGLENIDLVFAGPDGGMLDDLRGAVARFNAGERVHFLGHLGGVDKSHALHAALLLAVPSRREAMSIVALEAAAAGTSIMLTDACGFDTTVFPSSRIVGVSADAIREGIISMTANPEELTAKGVLNRDACVKKYSWETRARDFLALYEEVLRDG